RIGIRAVWIVHGVGVVLASQPEALVQGRLCVLRSDIYLAHNGSVTDRLVGQTLRTCVSIEVSAVLREIRVRGIRPPPGKFVDFQPFAPPAENQRATMAFTVFL